MLAKVSNDCMSTKDLLVTAPREGPCMLALSVCMKPEHIAFFLVLVVMQPPMIYRIRQSLVAIQFKLCVYWCTYIAFIHPGYSRDEDLVCCLNSVWLLVLKTGLLYQPSAFVAVRLCR